MVGSKYKKSVNGCCPETSVGRKYSVVHNEFTKFSLKGKSTTGMT